MTSFMYIKPSLHSTSSIVIVSIPTAFDHSDEVASESTYSNAEAWFAPPISEFDSIRSFSDSSVRVFSIDSVERNLLLFAALSYLSHLELTLPLLTRSYTTFSEGAQSGLLTSWSFEGAPLMKWSGQTRVLWYCSGKTSSLLTFASQVSCLFLLRNSVWVPWLVRMLGIDGRNPSLISFTAISTANNCTNNHLVHEWCTPTWPTGNPPTSPPRLLQWVYT